MPWESFLPIFFQTETSDLSWDKGVLFIVVTLYSLGVGSICWNPMGFRVSLLRVGYQIPKVGALLWGGYD